MEGFLSKRGRGFVGFGIWKIRFFRLFESTLEYTDKRGKSVKGHYDTEQLASVWHHKDDVSAASAQEEKEKDDGGGGGEHAPNDHKATKAAVKKTRMFNKSRGGHAHRFFLRLADESEIELQADNEAEANKWVSALSALISKLDTKRREDRKEWQRRRNLQQHRHTQLYGSEALKKAANLIAITAAEQVGAKDAGHISDGTDTDARSPSDAELRAEDKAAAAAAAGPLLAPKVSLVHPAYQIAPSMYAAPFSSAPSYSLSGATAMLHRPLPEEWRRAALFAIVYCMLALGVLLSGNTAQTFRQLGALLSSLSTMHWRALLSTFSFLFTSLLSLGVCAVLAVTWYNRRTYDELVKLNQMHRSFSGADMRHTFFR